MRYPFCNSVIVLPSDQPGYGIPPVDCQHYVTVRSLLSSLFEISLSLYMCILHLTPTDNPKQVIWQEGAI